MRKLYAVLTILCCFLIFSCAEAPKSTEPTPPPSPQTVRESVFVIYKVELDEENPGFSKYSIKMSDYQLLDADITFRDYSGKYLVGDALRFHLATEPAPENVTTVTPASDTTKIDSIAWIPRVNPVVNEEKPTNISKK